MGPFRQTNHDQVRPFPDLTQVRKETNFQFSVLVLFAHLLLRDLGVEKSDADLTKNDCLKEQ
jgi:hypothetical protein